MSEWRDIPISAVEWGDYRAYRAIIAARAAYPTLGALADAPETEILRLPNVNRRSLGVYVAVIRRAMAGKDVRVVRKIKKLSDLARVPAPCHPTVPHSGDMMEASK